MGLKQEDLRKLWKWCGLIEQSTGTWYEDKIGGKFISTQTPSLTLTNIYEYAIPKLQKEGKYIYLIAVDNKGFVCNIEGLLGARIAQAESDSPTEALYNAIMKVIDNEKEK